MNARTLLATGILFAGLCGLVVFLESRTATRGPAMPYGRQSVEVAATLSRASRPEVPAAREDAHVLRGPFTDVDASVAERSASAGERLRISLPSGRVLEPRFVARVQHQDGSWSWVGRTSSQEDVILTFGKHAVYGYLGIEGAEPARVTTFAGHPVIEEPRPTNSGHWHDFEAARAKSTVASSAQGDVLPSGMPYVFRLAVGYTPGFANEHGGDSAAATRLYHLVDVANQAFANSGLNARIALASIQPVAYVDTTTQQETLTRLTGFSYDDAGRPLLPKADQIQQRLVNRDPALYDFLLNNGFGFADAKYDMYAIARAYRAPEQAGCGAGWIWGSTATVEVSYFPIRHFVFSDGSDLNETSGRVDSCPDSSLARQVGFVLGQTGIDDANPAPGKHSYSHGYREQDPAGFYTLTADPLPGASQFPLLQFSNPLVTHLGRSTGVAGVADNAASIVVQLGYGPGSGTRIRRWPRFDFNADRRSDLVWTMADGTTRCARMNWPNIVEVWGPPAATPSGSLLAGRLGFFTGNSQRLTINVPYRDLKQVPPVYQLCNWDGGGPLYKTFSATGGLPPQGEVLSLPSPWTPVASMNARGTQQVVLRNNQSEAVVFWRIKWLVTGDYSLYRERPLGALAEQSRFVGVSARYSILATGDFDGDGDEEILWGDDKNELAWTWKILDDGPTVDVRYVGGHTPEWSVAAIADINGDGKQDVIWRNEKQELMAYWLMDGPNVRAQKAFSVSNHYRIVVASDFDGDGVEDIAWEDDTNSLLWVWRSRGDGNFDVQFAGAIAQGTRVVNDTGLARPAN